jgi:hypothetical protein
LNWLASVRNDQGSPEVPRAYPLRRRA